MKRAIYSTSGLAETEKFFDSLYSEAKSGSESTLDAVAVSGVAGSALASQGQIQFPDSISRVLDAVPEEEREKVLCSVLTGMDIYQRDHGCLPTADLIENAIHQGYAASQDLKKLGIMDSIGTTSAHDALSSVPGRTIIAITSAISEGIPFATYLPADINSNEARLAIVSHLAATATGDYAVNDLLDGINSGDNFLTSERRVTCTLDAERDAATGKINTVVGTTANVQVLRGRTIILVNGFPVAAETTNAAQGVANVPVTGVATIEGTDYTISGTVTTATGAIALAFAPALPVGTVVEAEGFIDFEAQPTLAPRILTQVQNFSLYAVPWRATTDQTIDSRTQGQNELGMDLMSESVVAVRNQYANERHYMGLIKLKALAANNAATYDFDYVNQMLQKTRAQVWQDFTAILGQVDQQMAEDTMDHGITHLYVPKNVAAQMMGLPRELFEPSGIVARPGIFRIGRLFGRFEVYYTPKHLTETSTSAQILCVGRSPQVARCPLVLGDAVPPTYIPLAVGSDLKYGNGFYARGFTSVNPHVPSAKGAALITVTNLFSA